MDEFEILTKIKRAIEEKGLSQADVGGVLGVAPSTVSLYLSGNRPLSLRRLIKLVELAEINLGMATPGEATIHQIEKDVGVDMAEARHPELLRSVFKKLVQLDANADTEHLIRVDAQIDAFLSMTGSVMAKKKRA